MQQLEFFEVLDKPTSVCPYCKKIFEKNVNHQKFCSIRCKNKKFNEENKELVAESKKRYRIKNIEKIKEKKKISYQKNKKAISEKFKIHYNKNKEKILERHKLYYVKNIEKIKIRKSIYCKNNREKYNKRYKEDAQFRLTKTYRARIVESLKLQKTIKSKKTLELLGCSWQEARDHLESQFKEGMTWDNHGQYGWHIDHIIPCSSFDLTDLEQQKKCFHYTNLQPLWWKDNISKGSKILENPESMSVQ